MSIEPQSFVADSPSEHSPKSLLLHPTSLLCCFLVALAIYRLSLIRSGHFFWGDEIRYLRAGEALDDFSRGDYRSAAARLFHSLGRPGFILFSVFPTWLAKTIETDSVSEMNPLVSYDVAAAFNVFVSLAITVLVYVLARTWRVKASYALLAAITYSLLAQSNVWIKHLVPYHESLLLFLMALWLISRKSGIDIRTLGCIALAGCLSALAFATYPGHYMFVIINLACVVASTPCREATISTELNGAHSSQVVQRVKRLAAFSGGALTVVLFMEGLAQYAGTTWVGSSSQFAPTMGLFSEGYAFAWHYLRDGEGLIGIVLSFLFVLYIARLIANRRLNIASIAILAATACYLIHATLGVVFHKTVFYGRILLMYMPFVVIGAVMVIYGIRSAMMRRTATGILAIALCWSFAQFAIGYTKLTYPADLWYDTVTHSTRGAATLSPDELYGSIDGSPLGINQLANTTFTMVVDSQPEGSSSFIPLAKHEDAQSGEAELIGVNIRWMFYIQEREDRFIAPRSHRLIAEATHPLAFPPLQFEGFRPCERKRMQERQYTMRIYQRNSESNSQASEVFAEVSH